MPIVMALLMIMRSKTLRNLQKNT
ncbi:hypothetical protein Goklo_005541 [Gossypium klotzschianum]|uniref:Uncharacterized protein n=1 Tax=Gossypium klotzschianum TaxID=34286 RepID=A0A7J8VEZ9_9ROSI|nr:hypothetical protein [Gossypium klotzschianum]